MRLLIPIRSLMVVLIITAGLHSAGRAQTTSGTPTRTVSISTKALADEKAQPGSKASSTPGKMVIDRLAQLQNTAPLPPVTISTATDVPSFWDQIIASLVTALTELIQNFLADLFGTITGNGNSNNNTNGNANSNTNDNTNGNDNSNSNANDNSNSNSNDNTSSIRPPQTGVRKHN